MSGRMTGVLKKNTVRAAGRSASGAGMQAPSSNSRSSATARIVEQLENTAKIEVTCACDRRILLHCDLQGLADTAPTGEM